MHEAGAALQRSAGFVGQLGHGRPISLRRAAAGSSLLRALADSRLTPAARRDNVRDQLRARGAIIRRLFHAIDLDLVRRRRARRLAALSAEAGTLDQVKARGQLICGVGTGLAGFGLPDDQGVYKGLDVDECRAIAAAIFNDPNKGQVHPAQRQGPADHSRLGRDRRAHPQHDLDDVARDSAACSSPASTIYDGQGFMVRKSLGIDSALKLDGASVCVQQGTTTELNLADFFRAHAMKLEAVVFATDEEATKAYDSGRCDAYTTDASGLYSERLKMSKPDDHIVLPEIISKEPLGPVGAQGRRRSGSRSSSGRTTRCSRPRNYGVTQANVDEMLKSPNPNIRRLLGVEGDFGQGLGLTNDWAYRIIKAVGNYGEIVRAQRRHGLADQDQAGPERAVDQGRPAIRAADKVRAGGAGTSARPESLQQGWLQGQISGFGADFRQDRPETP